jgi:hypothetical protein
MNDYESPEQSPSNIKILVRIRNHPEKEGGSRLNETGESLNRIERPVTPTKSRDNSNSMISRPGASKGKEPVKGRTKSPSIKESKSNKIKFFLNSF